MGLQVSRLAYRTIFALSCLLFSPRAAFPVEYPDSRPSTALTVLQIDARSPGPTIDVEFVGNASRLNAFVDISSSPEIKGSSGGDEVALPDNYFRARYPYFSRLRIGNLFFGYECFGGSFQELAVREPDGAVRYQFEETLRLIEELLRGGLKPQLALTGIPKALIPVDETILSHPAYGCLNAPAFDWSKREPKERVPEWWRLQDSFIQALIARFGIEEVRSWTFATWTEPWNPERKKNHHLVLPEVVIKRRLHDEAVATIVAASIDVAMQYGLSIHIGNLAGSVEQIYPKLIAEIKRFPKGVKYLEYIDGYAISRYRVKPSQDVGEMLDRSFGLLKNPMMPDKPLFIDEFGELTSDDGISSFGPANSFEGAAFLGSVLARVFNRQDGSARVPKSVAFWNNQIAPRAKLAFKRYDDYLKTPATNVMGMFASLKGYRKIDVAEAFTYAVAGVRDGQVKVVLLGDHKGLPGGIASFRHPVPNVKEIVIRGLKASAGYQVVSSTINGNYGNPISVFLGDVTDFRQDPAHRFINNGKKWKLAPGYGERCFFDEVKDCSWREKAQRLDSPLLRLVQAKTDANGVLRVPIDIFGFTALMLEVSEVAGECPKGVPPIELDFNSGTDWLARVQPKFLEKVSFDAGASAESALIRNDERNQGLRFGEGSKFVLACSNLEMKNGRVAMRFKADGEFTGSDMTLMQQGLRPGEWFRVTLNKGIIMVEQGSGNEVATISTPLPVNKNNKWNYLEIEIKEGVLRVLLNGQPVGSGSVKLVAGLPSPAANEPRSVIFVGSSPDFGQCFKGVIDDLWIGTTKAGFNTQGGSSPTMQ